MAEGSLKLALQWKELFAEAKQQIDSGDFAGSLSTLEKAQGVIESLAAAENTGRPELRLAETFERMAYAYHQQGILTDAERLYRSALEIANAHMISFFVKEAISQNLARLFIETGREAEGQALLQRYPVRDEKPALEVELSQQLVQGLLLSVSNLVFFAGDKAAQVSSLMGELVDYCENAYGSDSDLFAEAAKKQGNLQMRMETSSADVWFKRSLLAKLNSGCANEDIVPIAVDVALSERNSTLGKALTVKYPDRNEHSIHNIANSVAQKISAQLGATAPSSTVSSSTTPSMSVAEAEQVIEDWRKSQPAIVGILMSEAERYKELLVLIDKALFLVEEVERNESHPLSTISILSQKSRLLQKLGDIAAAKACKEKELQVISSHWGEGHIMMIEAYEEYLKL